MGGLSSIRSHANGISAARSRPICSSPSPGLITNFQYRSRNLVNINMKKIRGQELGLNLQLYNQNTNIGNMYAVLTPKYYISTYPI